MRSAIILADRCLILVFWYRTWLLPYALPAATISMARAQGINTDFNRVLGLMISNGLVALSGAHALHSIRALQISIWAAVLLSSAWLQLSSVKRSFGRIFRNFGSASLLAVALGSILYYLVLQAVIWLGIDTDLLKLLSALVVAVFLAIPYWKGHYFSKPVKRGGNRHA